MNVNINSIRFGYTSNRCLIIEVDKEQYYVSEKETLLVQSCFNGESEVYPFFRDGYNLFQPHPKGMNVIRLNSYSSYSAYEDANGKYRNIELIFPGEKLAELIETFLRLKEQQDENDEKYYNFYDISSEIPLWKEKYAPKVKTVSAIPVTTQYHNDSCKLKEILDNLIRIAEDNSDGDVVTVKVILDYPTYNNGKANDDYYFEITKDNGKRIMNGGIIYHTYDCQYHMHT